MRRKTDELIPLEADILDAAIQLLMRGVEQFHGYAMAKELREISGARTLAAHGTLYKALGRMETAGWVKSRWEDASPAGRESRPRRRLYRVTTAGQQQLAAYQRAMDRGAGHLQRGGVSP